MEDEHVDQVDTRDTRYWRRLYYTKEWLMTAWRGPHDQGDLGGDAKETTRS
jgi:hypothetical protein